MNSGFGSMGQDKLSIRKPSQTMPVDDRMTETEDETQIGPSNLRANRKSRDPDFSNEENDRLILLITEKHNNGDLINGNPTSLAWIEITKKTAQQLNDSWKTLKKEYRKYHELAGRSGWGWDPVKNIPDAIDDLWEEILQVYPKYESLRRKSFTHYEAVGDLITNMYALGNHARSSVNYMSTAESLDANVQVNANDFTEHAFDAKYVSGERSSFAEDYIFVEDNDVTRDPSSGSGGKHVAESSKERRRRKKSFTKDDAECLLSEARNKINIALQAMQHAMSYTMEDPMKKLACMQNLTDTVLCAMIDAFNETPNNITVFMMLDGSRLETWVGFTVGRYAQFGRMPIFTNRPNPSFDPPPTF